MSLSPYAPPRLEKRIARTRSWVFAYASLTLIGAITSPVFRRIDPKCDWNLCLIAVFLVAVFGRMFGWSLNWPTGRIGRHAVAFFVSAICGSAATVWLHYVDHDGDFMRDFRDGIAAMSLIYGIGFGIVAEFVGSVAGTFYANAISGQRS